ncbi:MAG: DNA polymerase V [Thiobacillus sp. SCN 63-374]|jgi:DNA polymerase V|uniref:LexA family protein n=1 Tax=Thiobacillus denitrificans TaxID=36861 RepID=UPI0003790B3B|nr:translesion error-prone DNA polymerase V autoproteolytic subunit [Thiobacillus denitrificans]ODU49453.1 MAG: DNA polymerase V [Thiobacillus sp. SCN 63-374]OZA31855.1 MAG: DNA polymerase V [Hydrogenophilales bacterium 17-64-65]
MSESNKSTYGGPRPGAGRPKGEPTKVIRLPIRLAPVVQALVEAPPGTRMPHPDATPLSLPMFGHKVRAGFPSPADDYIEAWLDLNEHLVEHKDATFFVRATGDSMTGAGIQEGNLLVVDRALEAKHRDIVIAVVDGEMTVKRLDKRRGRIRLLAENPAYEPIEFQDGQELTIWGVVTSVIQRFKR